MTNVPAIVANPAGPFGTLLVFEAWTFSGVWCLAFGVFVTVVLNGSRV